LSRSAKFQYVNIDATGKITKAVVVISLALQCYTIVQMTAQEKYKM